MQDFTKLKVWQKAHTFTVNLYKLTANFPADERFGLTNQIRRASVSIESNISEGCGRGSSKELSRFIDIAQGSAFEVRCQILVAKDLKYLTIDQANLLESKITEVSKMLTSLNQKTKN